MNAGQLRNCIFCFVLLITSFLGSLFILFPLLPLLFVNRPVWRRVVDQIIGLWLCIPVGILEYLHGVRFRVTGDKMSSSEKAIIIMNHRTRLDWLFLWSALYRHDHWLLTTEKIILKSPLRRILGAGWAMECDNFIFLERSLERDAVILSESAQYLSSTGNSYQVLIFPEGTDLCPNTIVKSDAYAEKKNLPLYRNVLHPRTSGLSHLVRELKRNHGIDYIYDFTVAYPKEIVQTEIEFAKTGRCPSVVDFHCRRYRLDEIMKPEFDAGGDAIKGRVSSEANPGFMDAQLQRWCEQLWQRKEVALSRYYGSINNNNYNDDEDEEKPSLEEAFSEGGDRAANKGTSCEISPMGKTVVIMALIYWTVSVSFWLYALFAFAWLKYFALAGIIVFKSIEFFYMGIERFEIELWNRSRKY